MLSFAVFDDEGPARQWPLRHALLMGADDVPLQADIRFSDGVIRCEKRGNESAGLSLQVPVHPPADMAAEEHEGGLICLQTCLLPDRERPYLLSLELARHRIMLVVNKLEDWALFDLPPDHPALVQFEEARRAFTEAVVAHRGVREGHAQPPELTADRCAKRSLWLAIKAGETLALEQARFQLERRLSGELINAARAINTPANAITDHETKESRNALIGTVGVILPSPPQIGVTVAPGQMSPSLQSVVQDTCDFVNMPMRWIDMEPTEGRYLFGQTDRWIEWAVRTAKLPLVGGPIIDFRPECVPEWLYIWEHDYETLRELVYEHVRQIVTRYRRTINTWTVVSGLHVNKNFSLTFEQIMDLTRLCVTIVRKLQPGCKIQVEIDQPWGEYVPSTARSIPPLLYAEMIAQAGISADLYALRIEMGQPEPGRATRDMMALSALLDRFAMLEVPLAISAISAPATPPDPESLGLGGQLDPGYWRSSWSPETQRRWMAEAIAITASKPCVHSVCWQELYDSGKVTHLRHTGLIDAAGQPRPTLSRLSEIRRAIRERRPVLDPEPAAVS